VFDIFRNKNVKNIELARYYFSKGNLKKAANICNELLEKNKSNMEALKLLGEIYLRDNELSNYKDVSLRLVDIYIQKNNFTSSIALLRRLIKKFPDDVDIYNKFLNVYEKSNMKKELLETLFVIGDIYLKKNLYKESTETFSKLLKFNRNDKSIDVCFNIINRFLTLDNKLMVASAVRDGITFAKEKNDIDALYKLFDIASKYDSDISENITLSVDFFTKNKDKLNYFIKHSINYLINLKSSLDIEFFKKIIRQFDFNEIKEIIIKVHDKYKNIELYENELNIFAEKKDLQGLMYVLENLYRIENPSKEMIDFLIQYYNKIDNPEILYTMALFLIRCKDNLAALNVLMRAKELTSDEDRELKAHIEERMEELNNTIKGLNGEHLHEQSGDHILFRKVASVDELVSADKVELPEIDIIFEKNNKLEQGKDDVSMDEKIKRSLKLINSKFYREAIMEIKPLLGGQRDYDVLYNIGLCYEMLNEFSDAIEYYRSALKCATNRDDKCKLLKKIADLYFDMRNKEKTYETIFELYKINSHYF
jgi:tetratricopeptide (TPR) repeat protein